VEDLQSIVGALSLSNAPLKSFHFEFKGNGNDEKVDFGQLLTNLTELEQLTITDSKDLSGDVKYIVGGERSYRYRLHGGLGITPEYSETLIRQSTTNISPALLTQLPGELRKLCLSRFIPEENLWFNSFQNPICMEKFKRLTKLEIRGPYIHSLHLVIPKILTLVQLETLALTNCDLQDTFIMGLGWTTVLDLRRCLTYSLTQNPPTTDAGAKTIESIDKTILETPNSRYRNGYISLVRPKLSDLANLKYLDLSHNPQISDLGIYDSMRLPLVETLILNDCSRVTDSGLRLIGLNFPSLKILSVKYCRKMSQNGLIELIKVNKNLQRIHTTRGVTKDKSPGFGYTTCPNYNDIVRTTIATESTGFICDEME